MSTYHTPVLLQESVAGLDIKESGVYVDATLGGGGHTREILSHLGPKGRLMVFDRDSDALANAPKDKRIIVVHNNFRYIHHFVRYYGFEGVDGILADLGVSSHQFDTSERGFSFRFDAPLDMRMNTQAKKDARTIINEYEEEEIARLLKLYGEVDNSRKVASLICSARSHSPITTTGELTEAIKKVLPPVAEHKFLAKIYQALRIEVNGEMESLQYFLKGAERSLKPGGRLSVITYHSLEDRMVKNFIKTGSIDGNEEKDLYGRRLTTIKSVNKKPILPSDMEIAQNTRARSAKLRIGEKIDG
ncbi:MAG: 16S rRNA (cytosine(1402)-N(4))-methyltransferase RsmH [Bacteroidales bacterium]|nr:16S rRNA (cytosine(1402)-N(4))-methyltransferase RsmH [Bacteroidales bacterium]